LPVSVEVANDDAFLYLRLASSDPTARQDLTRMGLIVWLDPKGGTKKHLGVQYPVFERSAQPDERDGHSHGGYGGRSGRSGGHGGGGEGEGDEPHGFSAPDRVDIFGPGKDDARSLTREHVPGIEVAMTEDHGAVLYELKVPLATTEDHPYAVGATAGKTIGIGIETPKPQHASSEGRGGGMGGMGGGMGRGGGGYGGHGGGMGGGGHQGGEFQPPKPLSAWATVTLR
jgi:hypothetical protein